MDTGLKGINLTRQNKQSETLFKIYEKALVFGFKFFATRLFFKHSK
jgi:hypothetical protein